MKNLKVSSVRSEQLTAFFVPDNRTDFHPMVAVAIRTDDLAGIGLGLVEASFLPAGDDLCRRFIDCLIVAFQPASDDRPGRDIMGRAVTGLTIRLDFLRRIHGLRRRRVVLVISMSGGFAVAMDAADIDIGMAAGEKFGHVVGVTYETGGVFNSCFGVCSDSFLLSRFIKQ